MFSFQKIKTYWSSISTQKAKDSGVLIALAMLILSFFTKVDFSIVVIVVLFLSLLYPLIFYPLAFIVYGFSEIMGIIIQKLIMSLLFLILVVPVALFRQILGKDALKIKNFKKNNSTVFVEKNQEFTSKDLELPY